MVTDLDLCTDRASVEGLCAEERGAGVHVFSAQGGRAKNGF